MTRTEPAGDTDYERTGAGYETLRRADPRIAAQIAAALGPARIVLNVGAGAGSYEPTDRHVLAVEPSATMRARRSAAGLPPAVDAAAEALPFDDDAVDAAMATLTVHQWSDLRRGLGEVRRVTRGPVVLMTLDFAAVRDFWLHDYVPERLEVEERRFPGLDELTDCLGGTARVEPVPVPLHCTDSFVEAFYGRPEALLDEHVRAAQSAWGFLDPAATGAGLRALRDDLASGAWDERYGAWRTTPTWSGPVVLLVAEP